MANIGTFTAQNDSFTGTVRTLTLNVKVKFVPNAKESENAPDYRIVAGNFEIGAAWKRVGGRAGDYIALEIDSPLFLTVFRPALFQADDDGRTFRLAWKRPRQREDRS